MIREDLFPSEPPVLERERIRVRPVDERDVPALQALYSDPEVLRYIARPALEDLDAAREAIGKILAGYADGSSLQLAIERKDDRAFLGLCLLFRFHKSSRRAELGYALNVAHWSKGYANEAIGALVAHAFTKMQLNRLEADIDPRNSASARLLEKLGFKAEGILRERWIVKGEVSDSRFYGLLRSEWVG